MPLENVVISSWSQERESHSPVFLFLVYLVICDGQWMKPLKIGMGKIERNSWNCNLRWAWSVLRSYFVWFFRGLVGGKILHQTDQIMGVGAGGIEASGRRWRCFLAGETPLNLHVEKGCCCKMVSRGTIFNRILYEGQRDLNHRYFYNSTINHAYELEHAAENYNPWGESDTHRRILLESGGSIQTAERCISKVRSYVSHHFWQHIEIGWTAFDNSSDFQFVSETNVGL